MRSIIDQLRKSIRKLLDMLCAFRLAFKLRRSGSKLCEGCASEKIRIFSPYWRHPLLECENCGLKFAAYMPKISRLKKLHNDAYWKEMYEYLGFADNPNTWEEWKQWKQSLFASLGVGLDLEEGGSKRVLDVGCGNGALLELFLEKGWECVGVDFSDFLAGKSFPPEMDIINSSFESVDFPKKKFNIVSVIHTLEHFRHPAKCLLKAKKYLREDGLIFIEVPLTQNYTGIHHRFFFSKESIHKMLLNVGLKVVGETTYRDKIHLENELLNLVLICK